MAHKWVDWLQTPCRVGAFQRFRAEDKISNCTQVGFLAPQRLPSRQSRTIHNRQRNQRRPTTGQIGYIVPTVQGLPNILEDGTKTSRAHKWAHRLHNRCGLKDPNASPMQLKSTVAQTCVHCPHNHC